MGFHQYNVYKTDKNTNTSAFTRGGGVLIAVNKKLFSRLFCISIHNLEQVFVLVNLGNKCIIIGVIYMPVRSNKQLFLNHFSTIENLLLENTNSNFILLEDYNLPFATFCDSENFFNEQIFNLNLSQFNDIININGITLDSDSKSLKHCNRKKCKPNSSK